MRTLKKVIESPSAFDSLANYIGELPEAEWLCLLTQTRDSDCLARSNFRSALRELGGASETVRVDRFGHWACGWWESLSVLKDSPAETTANQIEENLEGYPVVDEDDFSELETEEANQVWRDCFRTTERIAYIRKHRSQFEFHDFSDLLGCARGNYFAGYASELLS